jgi:hypothetical protein
MNRSRYILFLLLLVVMTARAQEDRVSTAISYVEKSQLSRAKESIDSTVLMSEYMMDDRAWYVRGYVLKELFRKSFPEPKNIKLLGEESFNSFIHSCQIDTSKENVAENKKNIQSLAVYFNNYAAKFLDSTNASYAVICIEDYKKCMLYVNPNADLKEKEIEFYVAAAALYQKMYEKNTEKKLEDAFRNAEKYFHSALRIDSSNYAANYNLSMLYYNEGVEMINSMPIDEDIIKVNEVMDKTADIFKLALPLMLKAYKIKPNRVETVKGLRGIYHQLYDNDQEMAFKQKLMEVENNSPDNK